MKLSALVFDLDGTAIPIDPHILPSKKVIEAVNRVQRIMPVSIATGRPISNSQHLFKALNIKSPSIVAGGTQIIDPLTKNILWEKKIPKEIVEQIIDFMKAYQYGIYLSDSLEMKKATQIQANQDESIIYINIPDSTQDSSIYNYLVGIEGIAVYKVKPWDEGYIQLHITHQDATKKNAVEKLIEMLGVKLAEVMAVGDSDNDLPLFASAGLKVAMGNGSRELKKQADYIAPSVDQDGLAEVINKFILN